MSSRGEILDVLVGGQRARPGPRLALPEGVERVVSEKRLTGSFGFPLLPEKEARPGDTWNESFHLGKGIGEGVVFVPVKVTYRYRGNVVSQRRNCAVLTFKLAGELTVQGGTIRIEGEGQLVFDYENGIDVKVQKKIVETQTPSREGERSSQKISNVVKRLSEIPLLGPP